MKISLQCTISPTAKHQSCPRTILTNPQKTLFTLLNQCRRRKKVPREASRELAFRRGGAHCKTICFSPDGEAKRCVTLESHPSDDWRWELKGPGPGHWALGATTRLSAWHARLGSFKTYLQSQSPWALQKSPSSMPELGQPLLLSWQIPGSSTSFSLSLFFFSLSLAQFIAGTNALLQKEFFWTVELKSNTPLHPSEATRTEAHENASVSQPKVLFGMRIIQSLS